MLRDLRAEATAQGAGDNALAGLTSSRARGMAADGRLPAIMIGRQWHARQADRLQIAQALGVPLRAEEPAEGA